MQELDETIGYLMRKMREANLDGKVNILIVSDHGMAKMKKTLLIQNYLNTNLINGTRTVYGIVSNIYPSTRINNAVRSLKIISKN